MTKTIFLFTGFIILTVSIFAQSSGLMHGKLINKKTGEPVSFATVHIPESDFWTTSDAEGQFQISKINNSVFSIEVRCLGYEFLSNKYQMNRDQGKSIIIQLLPVSYDMAEITVLAKNNNGMSSSSMLESAAIEHIQPNSLADVLQLLPGNISTNPDFSTIQKISLRDVDGNTNNALGTSILIDEAPISNNANMQTFSTIHSSDRFSTAMGSGVDLRQIPTENIESVEFIKGIPSVVYGDLTSGALVIKTKSGYTPWEIKMKTNVETKQFTLGKGIKLKSNQSSINFNVDYLQSYDDLRSKYQGYKRLTTDVGFSKTFGSRIRPLTFNAKLSYFQSLDNFKTDPDALVANEKIKSNDHGLRFNIHGKWMPKLVFFDYIDYAFSMAYTHQVSSETRYRSTSGIQVISTSLVEGENIGIFLPSEQLTSYRIDGKPINLFGQLTASKIINFRPGVINKILYGFDYRLDKNFGDGQVFDPASPPFLLTIKTRPRNFRDIPALWNYSIYLEDKMTALLGKTQLELQAGLRLNNFQANGLLKGDIGYYAEPRVNVQYSFMTGEDNLIIDKMAIRFGIGKTYKAPPINYLYPDNAYFDLNALTYYVGNPAYDTSILNTRIFDTKNPELKPSENNKIEAGLIFKAKQLNISLTVFKEKQYNGFDLANEYHFVTYNQYQLANNTSGTRPDPTQLITVPTTIPIYYKKPVNCQETQNKGIEYVVDLGRIKTLYTKFTVDGALIQSKYIYSTLPYQFQPTRTTSSPYLFYGVYRPGEGKVSERFNTNLRMVTQIPKLRMIFSTTTQMVWYEKHRYIFYDKAPIYLVNADGSTTVFTDDMRKQTDYKPFVTVRDLNYYNSDNYPFVFQTNFRLSKDIRENTRLSFYVNNFVNYRPKYESSKTGSFILRNSAIYFGAEIKIIL